MFAVIFEVNPKPEQWDTYLGYARALRPELERIDGFLDNERFSSMRRPGWLLSLSTWRDEKAVIRWRIFARHHEIQERGRSEVFRDYHLRVGEIIADNQLPAGQMLPRHRFDETEIGAPKLVTIGEVAGHGLTTVDLAAALGLPNTGTDGVVDRETFAGINDPEKLLLLASWTDAPSAHSWRRAERYPGLRHRAVRIIRDYGMRDRREAPQYHPPVASEAGFG